MNYISIKLKEKGLGVQRRVENLFPQGHRLPCHAPPWASPALSSKRMDPGLSSLGVFSPHSPRFLSSQDLGSSPAATAPTSQGLTPELHTCAHMCAHVSIVGLLKNEIGSTCSLQQVKQSRGVRREFSTFSSSMAVKKEWSQLSGSLRAAFSHPHSCELYMCLFVCYISVRIYFHIHILYKLSKGILI